MKRQHILIIILFACAALLRFADVFRPINQASWRESDLGAVSRNFYTEGMNPFYPRIDWRGDGPGFAEMELPLFPWLTAVTYKIFGIHDQLGRIWTFLFSLGALWFFYRLARQYLTPFAATIAFAFFALNPLMVETATSIQPEGLMIFAYIAAVFFFIRWTRFERRGDFWAAVSATAFALLAKAPAAHVGLFFGILIFDKFGLAALRKWRVWAFGILSLAPAVLWYVHAKNLWITYGNSLGVSNEYHWVGWDFFTDAEFVSGIIRSEFIYVWIVFGAVVGIFAIWRGYSTEAARHALLWLASIFAFYILAARTTSEDWASYYHVFSIPPVALIFGLAIERLWVYMRDFADTYSSRSFAASVARAGICLIIVGSVMASLLVEAKQVRANFLSRRNDDPSLQFAEQARGQMTKPGPIIVSGGHCLDKNGYEIAYNASFMFYWLGRKGWNTCIERQERQIDEFRSKGAVYLVAQRSYIEASPRLSAALLSAYPVVSQSADFTIFDIEASGK